MAGRLEAGPAVAGQPERYRQHVLSRVVARSLLVHDIVVFFRENPQVLVLLIICLVLGIGTFLAVIFGLIQAGSTQTAGEPGGVVALALAV